MIGIAVRQAAQDRNLVGDAGGVRQQVGQADAGDVRAERMKVAANLGRSVRLEVPHIMVRHAAEDEDEDAIDAAPPRSRGLGRLQAKVVRQAEARDAADTQEAAAVKAVAEW